MGALFLSIWYNTINLWSITMASNYSINYKFDEETGQAYTADMGNAMEFSRMMSFTMLADAYPPSGGVVNGGDTSVSTSVMTVTDGFWAKNNYMVGSVEVPGIFYCPEANIACTDGQWVVARLLPTVGANTLIVEGTYLAVGAPNADTDVKIAQYTGGDFVYEVIPNLQDLLTYRFATAAEAIARTLENVWLNPKNINDLFPNVIQSGNTITIGATGSPTPSPIIQAVNGDLRPTLPNAPGADKSVAVISDIPVAASDAQAIARTLTTVWLNPANIAALFPNLTNPSGTVTSNATTNLAVTSGSPVLTATNGQLRPTLPNAPGANKSVAVLSDIPAASVSFSATVSIADSSGHIWAVTAMGFGDVIVIGVNSTSQFATGSSGAYTIDLSSLWTAIGKGTPSAVYMLSQASITGTFNLPISGITSGQMNIVTSSTNLVATINMPSGGGGIWQIASSAMAIW